MPPCRARPTPRYSPSGRASRVSRRRSGCATPTGRSRARPPPAGGRERLAERPLTQKIIGSHFHIWRQQDLPWLIGPMVPRIFGPYEPILREYPIEEFLADQRGPGVEKAVYVQTNWAKE